MLLTYLLCFLVTVIKVAVCESIQITVPCNGDEYEAGHAMLIEWYAHRMNHTKEDDPITIVLASGAAQNLTIDRIITNKTASLLGYYSWIIPRDMPPREDYVIEVGTAADNIAFAGYITINNKNSFGMTNSMDSTTLKSLPATRSIKKPSTTSVLTAYSPTKTATLVQEPKETTIFLNHLS